MRAARGGAPSGKNNLDLANAMVSIGYKIHFDKRIPLRVPFLGGRRSTGDFFLEIIEGDDVALALYLS